MMFMNTPAPTEAAVSARAQSARRPCSAKAMRRLAANGPGRQALRIQSLSEHCNTPNIDAAHDGSLQVGLSGLLKTYEERGNTIVACRRDLPAKIQDVRATATN